MKLVKDITRFISSCKHCGNEFVKKSSSHKYCSISCRENNKPEIYKKPKGMEEVSKKCAICNKEFVTVYPIQKYCSIVCKNKTLVKPKVRLKKVDCVNCGERFQQKSSHQKYCSETCAKDFYAKKYAEMKSINIKPKKITNCSNCGATIISEFNRKYCSEECSKSSRARRRKGISPENTLRSIVERKVINILEKAKNTKPIESLGVVISEFTLDSFTEKIKNEVRERDGHCCQVCEAKNERLEVHHILKRKLGGSNDLDNLITLCVKCHRAIETSDEAHAIKVCYKNAEKVNGRSIGEKLTNPEKINILMSCLEEVFDNISNDKSTDEGELLIKIGNALSQVQ